MTNFGNLATSRNSQRGKGFADVQPKEPFFPFTARRAKEAREADLTKAEWDFWSYLVTLDPFGNRSVEFSAAEVMLELGISKSTYFAAKAKFQKLGWFDFKDGTTTVRNRWGRYSPEEQEKFRTDTPKFRTDTPGFRTPLQDFGALSEISDSSELEQPLQKGSSSSQIYLDLDQSYSDLKERENAQKNQTSKPKVKECSSSSSASIQSELTNLEKEAISPDWDKFSAPGDDPKFFEFVVRKASKFENPVPADVQCVAEAWIRKQGHVLYPEYLEWQERLQRAEMQQVHLETEVPLLPVQPEMTEEERRANALARLQMKYKVPKFREAAIAESQQWGFVIDENGPLDVAELSSF